MQTHSTENLIASAFQVAPHLVWLLSLDGRVLVADEAARGVAPEAPAVGRFVWELSCWADQDGALALREACECVRGDDTATPFTTRIITRTSAALIADVSVQSFAIDDQRYLRVDAMDVTERARVETELRASRATFQGILGIAADAIISMDQAMRIVHFNRGAEQIFGWRAEDVIGQPLDVLLPERVRDVHATHIANFARAHETARRMGERREIFGLRHDGEEFPAEASISKLDIEEGRRLFTVVLRDVTERHRVEAGQRFLAEASEQLGHSLDVPTTLRSIVSLPVPDLADASLADVLDDDGTLGRTASTSTNATRDAALRILERQFPVTEDSPSKVVDVLRTRRGELLTEMTDELLEAHTTGAEHLAAARALDAASAVLVPLVAHDHALGVLTLLRGATRPAFDDADLQLAQEYAIRAAYAIDNAKLHAAARRATHARDDVLSVVSHDLRNPLSAIAMCSRVLIENPPGDEEARRELLTAIHQSTGLANRMIQDLLDVTQIEAGRLSVDLQPRQLHAVLELARPIFESQANERGIALEIEPANDLPPVLADEERVLQVLANLVGNATKFTDPGGKVTVRARRHDADVIISVADTGIGIPDEQRELIFQRFWHERRNAQRRGTGLGLAIAKGIVDAHGGRIWVEGTRGRGSTFLFTLPVAV